MNIKVEYTINKMNNLLNAKYEKNPDFDKQKKNWAFFVSIPLFIKLKRAAGDYTGVGAIVLIREVSLEIFGSAVFASDSLEENDIYFAEKFKIKED